MNEIDEIRWQMAQIRHDLHQDVTTVVSGVSDVVSEVTEVMDWRSLVRGHPYLIVGTGLALGYLIVPRRKKRVTEQELDRLAAGVDRLAASTGATAIEPARRPQKRFRPASWAWSLLAPIATQAIQAYAMMYVENWLKQYAQMGPDDGHPGQPPRHDAPYSVHDRFR